MNKILILILFSSNVIANTITVLADKAIIDKQYGVIEYIGNAVLTQNDIFLRADEIKIIKGSRNYQVFATSYNNNYSVFKKASVKLISQAKRIIYLSKDGFIGLNGDAKLIKNGNSFTGETIDYDNTNDKVLMNGKKGKRVKLKIKL